MADLLMHHFVSAQEQLFPIESGGPATSSLTGGGGDRSGAAAAAAAASITEEASLPIAVFDSRAALTLPVKVRAG